MRLSYLAAPYSSPSAEATDERMKAFYEADAYLTSMGHFTVSPLLKHPIVKSSVIPGDWAYWETYSKTLLSRCDELLVLQLPGWNTSTGVAGEIAFAKELGIPVFYIDPYTLKF